MQLEVRLFARARDLAGSGTIQVEVSEPATVAAFRAALTEQFPALSPLAPHLHVAIGTEYARDDSLLTATDLVACFPPVSGG